MFQLSMRRLATKKMRMSRLRKKTLEKGSKRKITLKSCKAKKNKWWKTLKRIKNSTEKLPRISKKVSKYMNRQKNSKKSPKLWSGNKNDMRDSLIKNLRFWRWKEMRGDWLQKRFSRIKVWSKRERKSTETAESNSEESSTRPQANVELQATWWDRIQAATTKEKRTSDSVESPQLN